MTENARLELAVPCTKCDGCFWVCESHPDRPWDGNKACGCGGAGEPCPQCNPSDRQHAPKHLPGFRMVCDRENGWRH